MSDDTGIGLLERLDKEGIISSDDFRSILLQARRHEVNTIELLLTTFDESALLGQIASLYSTRFVSTSKLARASVRKSVVLSIPRRTCNRLHCFPILIRKEAQTLVVITSDPESHDVAKELGLLTTFRRIEVLVARPAALAACIAKHYDGKTDAFSELVPDRGSDPLFEDSGLGGLGDFSSDFSSDFGSSDFGSSDFGSSDFGSSDLGGFGSDGPPLSAPLAAPTRTTPIAHAAPIGFTIEAPDIVAGLKEVHVTRPRPSTLPPSQIEDDDPLLDMVHVLVALLERDRNELRDHSAEVARWCQRLCERLELPRAQREAIVLAGYLHDLGKSSTTYHLTPLNVARYDGHLSSAKKRYLIPERLFSSVNLPACTLSTLRHLYERHDGLGFPDALAGKEIPLGARVLAIAETFVDLTKNPRNPYKRELTAGEAIQALAGLAEELFDPDLVELLKQHNQAGPATDRKTILLIDADPDETSVLDIRLRAAGFSVKVARMAEQAFEFIEDGVHVVVTEVDLPTADGFTIARALKERGLDIPLVFLAKRGDRATIERGYALGAADFLVKPTSPEVVVAKVTKLLESSVQGIAGSLSEMSLADVLQVIGRSKKTGRLVISSKGKRGKILVGSGEVWDAKYDGQRGEEAFFGILLIETGEFRFETNVEPKARLITAPLESLLLEGMRRLDESC